MSQKSPLAEYKRELRTQYQALRKGLDPAWKAEADAAILKNILALPPYQACRKLLCYVAMPDEIETRVLIQNALESGRQVAAPYCIPGALGRMAFYPISGLDELIQSSYGILEPDPAGRRPLESFDGALCIVPGLAYDSSGYRLGYGGGYYDRFLSGPFTGVSAGVCYKSFIEPELLHASYDHPCSWLVSETGVWKTEA